MELEAYQHLQIAEPRAAIAAAAMAAAAMACAGAGVGDVAFPAQTEPLLGLVPAAFGTEEACTAWKAGAHHPGEREPVRHHFVAGDQCCWALGTPPAGTWDTLEGTARLAVAGNALPVRVVGAEGG